MRPVKRIASRENPLFKELLKLASSSRQRRKSARTLLEGVHLVEAYHTAGGIPEHLVVSGSGLESREIEKLLKQLAGIPVTSLSDGLFAELSQLETPAGILAVISLPKPAAASQAADFIVLAERVQDPGNLGSILRSAQAAGVKQAYLSRDCADAWSPKVLRAAMGAHFGLDLIEGADLIKTARNFKGSVVAATLKSPKTLYQVKLTGPVAFIIGNEGAGISPALLRTANEVVTIPMPGGAESLNAAAAAAVCFFERVRQKKAIR